MSKVRVGRVVGSVAAVLIIMATAGWTGTLDLLARHFGAPTVSVNGPNTVNSVLNSTTSGGFQVQNFNGATNTYNLACQADGTYVLSCSVPPPTQITVPDMGTELTLVTGSTGSTAGTGWMRLVGTDAYPPFGAGNATITVVVTGSADPPTVTPDGTNLTYTADVSAESKTFTVSNSGSQTGNYTWTCTGIDGVVCTPGSGSVSVGAGSSTNVPVTMSAIGSGTLKLTATGHGGTDSGTYNVTINYPPKVAGPPIVTAQAPISLTLTQTGTQNFTVQNTGDTTGTFTLQCVKVSGVQLLSNPPTCPSSAQIPQFGSTTVPVSVRAGFVPGTASIKLTATESVTLATSNASQTITVIDPPSPPIISRVVANPISLVGGKADSVQFNVKNRDTAAYTFTLNCAVAGALPTNSCAIENKAPGQAHSLSLAANASQNVWAHYTAPPVDSTGTLTMSGVNNSASGQGSNFYSINGLPTLFSVDLAPTPSTLFNRPTCYSIPAGPEGWLECGELAMSHAMPTYQSLGRSHTLALRYQSGTANVVPVITADVAMTQSLPTTPDSVRVTLSLEAPDTSFVRWYDAAAFQQGTTQRIAMEVPIDNWMPQTVQIKQYALEVAFFAGVGPCADCVVSTSSEFVLLSREGSPYGNGWAIDGVSKLYPGQRDDGVLLIDGDGSHQIFEADTIPNRWVGPGVNFAPNVIILGSAPGYCNTAPTGTFYVRELRNRTTLLYETGGGRLTWVLDEQCERTEFTYTPGGNLTKVRVPPHSANLTYDFAYDSNSKIDFITDPAGRSMDISVNALGDLETFGDPGHTTDIKLFYTDRRLTSWDSRKTYRWSYEYAAPTSLLDTITGPVGNKTGVGTVQYAGFARDSVGLNQAAAEGAVRFTVDGPRTDVADVWSTAVNNFLAATESVNPLGDTTEVEYKSALALLPTKITEPGGRIRSIGYDGRGNVSSLIDNETGINATTTIFHSDSLWPDKVTRMTLPTKENVYNTYDATTGVRTTQYDDRGASSAVNFRYYTGGIVDRMLRAVDPPDGDITISADSLVYDGVGNLSEIHSPSSLVTTMVRDTFGRVATTLRPIDVSTGAVLTQTIKYDLMNRVIRTRDIGPGVTYQLTGETLIAVGGDSLEVFNEYDADGNLIRVTRSILDESQEFPIVKEWDYSPLGLPTAERSPEPVRGAPFIVTEGRFYDEAGNLKRVNTRRGQDILMQYDALNRMTQRIVPQVSYAQTTCAEHELTTCTYVFPIYPNDGATGLTVPSDVQTFEYDAGGNMTAANNNWAKISRTFTPGGLLQTDTTFMRTYQDSLFTPDNPDSIPMGSQDLFIHKFGVSYSFDLSGRVKTVGHPGNVAPPTGSDVTSYTYHPQSGALTTVTNVFGNAYEFEYDDSSRLRRIRYPGDMVIDSMSYDEEGRLVERRRHGCGTGTCLLLNSDLMGYDARGKMTAVTVRPGQPTQETITTHYSGLGNVVASESTKGQTGLINFEEFTPDGLGQNREQRSWTNDPDPLAFSPKSQATYILGTGILSRRETLVAPDTSIGAFPDTLYRKYDPSGNLEFSGQRTYTTTESGQGPGVIRTLTKVEAARHFYSADNKLAALQRYLIQGMSTDGVYEEYRYDALGRRIMVRSRPDSLCNLGTGCNAYIDRFVWDRDQILYELRAPSADALEASDPYALETRWVLGNKTGKIAYTHGGVIDRPMDIIRNDSEVAIPHTNWRGLYEWITGVDGRVYCDDPQAECAAISFPGNTASVFLKGKTQGGGTDAEWYGSLILGQQGPTGLVYQRNRYYDPETGQYTQEDPIGLAGGMNLYGFANGDPINNRDPFGLKADGWAWWELLLIGSKGRNQVRRVENNPAMSVFGARARVGANGNIPANFHQIGPGAQGNTKFVDAAGNESIFDGANAPVLSGQNGPTMNLFGNGDGLLGFTHSIDILDWVVDGTGYSDDKTTRLDRIKLLLRAIRDEKDDQEPAKKGGG
jgi:RHS repeat-associated protein